MPAFLVIVRGAFMFSYLYSPEYWLSKADKVSIRLKQVGDQDTREILLRLHEEYIMLARLAEDRRKEHKVKSS